MIKKLLGDNILVEIIKGEKQTQSGLIIPETVSDKNIQIGIVAFAGEGLTNDKGELKPIQVQPGDKVLFEKSYGASDIKIDNKDYLKISEREIIAIIE